MCVNLGSLHKHLMHDTLNLLKNKNMDVNGYSEEETCKEIESLMEGTVLDTFFFVFSL